MKKSICFDFDGVIHSYKSGWKGFDCIPDEPVDGIKEFIEKLKNYGYRIVVCTSRGSSVYGIKAVEEYLKKFDIPFDEISIVKPPAIVYIDDRGMKFDPENYEKMFQEIINFKTWMEE